MCPNHLLAYPGTAHGHRAPKTYAVAEVLREFHVPPHLPVYGVLTLAEHN